jgi:YHS domain-containing protein
MKLSRVFAPAVVVVLMAGASFGAAVKDSSKTTTPAKQPKPQTLCPVMGDAIDSAVYSDIQGQRIYYCCKKCEKKLQADPEKYFKKAAEDGVLFENIQKACPVTGKPIDRKFYVDYVGRRIFFSGDTCAAVFAQDPAKYLKVLDRVE